MVPQRADMRDILTLTRRIIFFEVTAEMHSRSRRRPYSLSYHLDISGSPCTDFRNFVVTAASSKGRELINHREDLSVTRCGEALEVVCATTGNATAEKLSRDIEAAYPNVIVRFARHY